MTSKKTIHCPTCGNHAQRQSFLKLNITETACPVCDYLMVNCIKTGNVVESHIPRVKQYQ